jgi:uncharacterized low-complexity protein
MSEFDNVWRLSTAQALAVASVGGAAASSSAFRHTDLRSRLQDCNRKSERWRRQLHCWHATATELG